MPVTPKEDFTAPEALAMESRLQEIEIKMAFLEKELLEYQEASRALHRRLSEMEEQVGKLQKESTGPGQANPELS